MHTLKRFMRVLSALGLRTALFGFALALTFLVVFGTPETIKSALASSNLYDIPPSEIIESEEGNQEIDGYTVSLEDPLVRQAAEEALPSERREEVANAIIDGTYTWLHGDAPHPDFVVDLSADKSRFINELADRAFARVEALEDCTPEQVTALDTTLNPLTVECKPPIDLEQQKQTFIAELSSSNEFIQDTRFDGEDLQREIERRVPAEAVAELPTLFAWFALLPLLFAGLVVVSCAGVVFFSEGRRRGLKRIGRALLGTSLALVIMGLIIYFATQSTQTDLGSQDSQQLADASRVISESLRWALFKTGILITVVYALVGAALLIILHRTKPATPEDKPETAGEPKAPTKEEPQKNQQND